MLRIVSSVACVFAMMSVGCGKYAPPIIPEMVAPSAVENLQVIAGEESISLTWTVSDQDLRGKELAQSEKILVERRIVDEDEAHNDEREEFLVLAELDDTHVIVRDQLRREARHQGRIGRRIEAPSALSTFSFEDSDLKKDVVYLYQIVPTNQGGVRGGIREQVQVLFKGVDSIIERKAVKGSIRKSGVPQVF